jgi:hypothetical protein
VPEPSAFQVEMATEKLKRHKSAGFDQITAELIKVSLLPDTYKILSNILLSRLNP